MRTRGGPQPPAPGGPSLRLGIIGVGGRGANNLEGVEGPGVTIVALCDCDERQAAKAFARYPEARRYADWRKMLEREKRPASTPSSSPRRTTTTRSSRSRR